MGAPLLCFNPLIGTVATTTSNNRSEDGAMTMNRAHSDSSNLKNMGNNLLHLNATTVGHSNMENMTNESNQCEMTLSNAGVVNLQKEFVHDSEKHSNKDSMSGNHDSLFLPGFQTEKQIQPEKNIESDAQKMGSTSIEQTDNVAATYTKPPELHLPNENSIVQKEDVIGIAASTTDLSCISSPPLSLQTVGDLTIMSVSQMTREYDNMDVTRNVFTEAAILHAEPTISILSTATYTLKENEAEQKQSGKSTDKDEITVTSNELTVSTSLCVVGSEKQLPSSVTENISTVATSALHDNTIETCDQEEIDRCVQMVIQMNLEIPSIENDHHISTNHQQDAHKKLRNDIEEALSENSKQSADLAEITTQSTPGANEASSCPSTQEYMQENESQQIERCSDKSSNEASSERTEDDDLSTVFLDEDDSHTSLLTPRESLLDVEVVNIADETSSPKTIDCKHIPQLADPISDGESFLYAGSINPSMKMRKNRYQKNNDNAEGISELVKKKPYPMKKLNKLYKSTVTTSKFRATRLTRASQKNDVGGTKIRIGKKCDHSLLAKKLSKLSLQNVEQLYLPTCFESHWILLVINFTQNAIEIYDSLNKVKDGEDPHKDTWETMGCNLQKSLNEARNDKYYRFMDFPRKYGHAGIQDNLDDCGFWVIKVLPCHNGKQLLGNYKISMDDFRKEICYVMVYHRFNDLNPRRPEIQKIASSSLSRSSG